MFLLRFVQFANIFFRSISCVFADM
jgi:hypothetical protein